MKKIDRIISESISDFVKDLLDSPEFSEYDRMLMNVEKDPKLKKRSEFIYKTYIKPYEDSARYARDNKYVQGQEEDI